MTSMTSREGNELLKVLLYYVSRQASTY